MNTFGLPTRSIERKNAELLLRQSVHWQEIEYNTDETREHYSGRIEDFAVREAAYNGAAETVVKWKVRPQLFRVWEEKAPELYKSAEYECTLFPPESKDYYDKIIQKSRMESIFESVKRLKIVEDRRPIREDDIEKEVEKILSKADILRKKKEATVQEMEEELSKIGDGAEYVDEFEKRLKVAKNTGFLNLNTQSLLGIPPQLFKDFPDLQIIDFENNQIKTIPSEIGTLSSLQKIYLGNNKIQALPFEIGKLHTKLLVLGLNNNPLQPRLKLEWQRGLPAVIDYFRAELTAQRTGKLRNVAKAGMLKRAIMTNDKLKSLS